MIYDFGSFENCPIIPNKDIRPWVRNLKSRIRICSPNIYPWNLIGVVGPSDEDSEEEEKEVVEPKQKRKKNDSIDTEKLKVYISSFLSLFRILGNEVPLKNR